MRRRLDRFIPIVLFTVLAQLIAPIGAMRAVANAVSDPLYMASICSSMTDSDDGHATPSNGSAAHGDCCVSCGAGIGGATVLGSPPLIFVTLQSQYQRVVWLEALDTLPTVRAGSNAQARAPPFVS